MLRLAEHLGLEGDSSIPSAREQLGMVSNSSVNLLWLD